MNKVHIKYNNRKLLGFFLPLLQQGVMITIPSGITIREMLSDQLCLTREYIERRIQSILLDGRPVDDLSEATLKDGVTLALSSSMPGLVGTTLRRGSPFASFRTALTHKESIHNKLNKTATIRLKLFNLIMSEIGPFLFKIGVLLETKRISELINKISSESKADIYEILLNDRAVTTEELLKSLSYGDEVYHLKVEPLHEL